MMMRMVAPAALSSRMSPMIDAPVLLSRFPVGSSASTIAGRPTTHIKMGKTPYRAALEAADEIGLAVIAISATIMAVFAPVSFMGGIAGQYFKQFGLTVAVAVFFSLLVARLLTPMLAAYFLRGHGHTEPKPGLVMRGYLRLLKTSLRFRWLTLLRHRLLRRLDLCDRPAAVRLHPERGCQPHHLLARIAARQPARRYARRHRPGQQADARSA